MIFKFIVILMLAVSCIAEDTKPIEKCEDYFEEVECKVCDIIEKEKPELAKLITLCKKCCVGDSEIMQKFDTAVFQLDAKHKMWQPELSSFIADHAGKFKKLKVTYESFSRPTLIMKRKDSNGKKKTEKVAVSSWKADQIADYLKDRLSE